MYTGKDDFFLYLHFIFKNKKKNSMDNYFINVYKTWLPFINNTVVNSKFTTYLTFQALDKGELILPSGFFFFFQFSFR